MADLSLWTSRAERRQSSASATFGSRRSASCEDLTLVPRRAAVAADPLLPLAKQRPDVQLQQRAAMGGRSGRNRRAAFCQFKSPS